MPRLTIDGKTLETPDGTLLMDAAAQVGIEIPALCHVQGVRPLTACMLCIVEETNSGRTFPSCSTLVKDGMVVETNNAAIRTARKEVLQLLLSEHVGDCEAPCRRICPASLDVPTMMHKVAAGDTDGAARLAKEALILPATLGYVCAAPCERGCRRGVYDEALLIRDMHRRLAEEALSQTGIEAIAPSVSTGKRVAIVGAGVSGLAAAWTLRRCGHACRVFEKGDRPGGALCALDEDVLPHAVFDAEVAAILQLGVELETNCEIGEEVPLADLVDRYDAVLLACGDLDDQERTVFRAAEFSSAVKSVGKGKQVAAQVDDFLRGLSDARGLKPFDCRLGRIQEDEKALFAVHRMQVGTSGQGRQEESFEDEARRCLHCDCLKKISCALRKYAKEYGARQFAYRGAGRPRIEASHRNDDVLYEPGKCIRCGLCVEITERAGEALGLGFVERGFDVRVRVPFGRSLEEGLSVCARACAEACPTGALALYNEEEVAPTSPGAEEVAPTSPGAEEGDS